MSKTSKIVTMEEWVRQKQEEMKQTKIDEYLGLGEYKVEQKVKQKKESKT